MFFNFEKGFHLFCSDFWEQGMMLQQALSAVVDWANCCCGVLVWHTGAVRKY
jgi:hypothetical protein